MLSHPACFEDKAVELKEVFAEDPGSFAKLERLRTAFVKQINPFYLYGRNKADGDIPKSRNSGSKTQRKPSAQTPVAFDFQADFNDLFPLGSVVFI